MSTDLSSDALSEPVESVDQLVSHFEEANKPRDHWRVGTEHEMVGVRLDAERLGAPIEHGGPDGIESVLKAMIERGWSEEVRDCGELIGLRRDGSGISIEPGGQFEHASAPVLSGDDFCAELRQFRTDLAEVSAERRLAWLSVGFRPFGGLDDVPWMPKRRYAVMREYLGSRGALAPEMMKRTATVQVNLDYSDREDARSKLRCAYATTSLMTALYANSAVVDGEVTGYQSYRAHVWHHTDPDRCGFLPFVFEDRCVFRSYAEWAMQVPVFFIIRDNQYLPTGGLPFARLVAEGFGGHRATMADWVTHLSTLFPEARLKSYIELRGCDAGSHGMIAGLGPLAAGLLYDSDARAAATALTAGLDHGQRVELSRQVAVAGLRARLPDGTLVGELVREMLDIAAAGLSRVAPADVRYLDPLREIAETGRTQADVLIEMWNRGTPTRERIAALAYPTLGGSGELVSPC